ncbi:MAG: pantoate--beta-alanine ligase [Actinomycetaceae bacterium]|nr:pantoate--beta-alanine ligase [Arcanobacterium sp.]MDD7504943.1 pantoate--beta-alanine ligase [Actinomycetaceae bacterium]
MTKTRAELRDTLNELDGTRALVMTMGALHEGHLSLVRAAKEAADHVIVSIYVNPLQFAPGEDFEAYPRDLDADVALLDTVGVSVVFAPSDSEMYPHAPLVRIDPGPVAKVFEGKTRPTHFAGVLQVVHKVFNLVQPDVAFFGQKDAQQLALIRTMVRDLDMPLEIRSVPIKREGDGLAMSSRNTYLTPNEHAQALALSRSLRAGERAAMNGADALESIDAARRELGAADGVKIDYLTGVNPNTFEEIRDRSYTGPVLLAVAAWVGKTRLIDNLEVNVK